MLLMLLLCAGCVNRAKHEPLDPSKRLAKEALGPPNVDIDSTMLMFDPEIERFLIDDSLHPDRITPIVFTGSSSIRKWKSLSEDMAPLPVLNRGFGGSTIPQVSYYTERILVPHRPKIIVLYAGENDIAWPEGKHTTPYRSFKTFVRLIRFHLPETHILFVSMKPSRSRWKYWPRFQAGNELIRVYCENEPQLEYIDVGPSMLKEDCSLKQDIFIRDGLHMNDKGYALWTEVIRPRVEAHWEIVNQ